MPTVVIIGVARGLGRGLAEEHRRRGWDVIGTVHKPSEVDDLGTEVLDTTDTTRVAEFSSGLAEVDRLVVVAGTGGPDTPIGEVTSEDFTHTMLVNTLAPLQIVDRLAGRVVPDGSIVVLTSDLGSVACADGAGRGVEAYRISKAGLNIGLRRLAARRDDSHVYLAVNPGWVETGMGGEEAELSVPDSSRQVVDVIDSYQGRTGNWFVNYDGKNLAW